MWIVGGALLYLAAMKVGEAAILKWIVAPDPALKRLVEEAQEIEKSSSKSDAQIAKEKNERRGIVFSSASLMLALAAWLIGIPLHLGGLICFFTRQKREAIVSIAGAAFFYGVGQEQFVLALVLGAVHAGLAAIGALLVFRLRRAPSASVA